MLPDNKTKHSRRGKDFYKRFNPTNELPNVLVLHYLMYNVLLSWRKRTIQNSQNEKADRRSGLKYKMRNNFCL